MKKEEIESKLRKGYFGEYNGEIDFLLSRIHKLEEAIDRHRNKGLYNEREKHISKYDKELYKVRDGK